MDYHQDRFADYSLMVFKNENLIATFPANISDGKVYSHQGLTYGGLILCDAVTFKNVLQSYHAILEFLNVQNINELSIKLLPKIYHTLPSDEINYLLFKTKANNFRTDLTSVIDAKHKLEIDSSNRIRGLKKAKKHNLVISEVSDFSDFWQSVLIPNLKNTHNVNPVHSLEEITELKSRFPKNIRQFYVHKNNSIVAGSTIFETRHVAHVQYISATENKQEFGSLDFLFDHLINNVFKSKKYFDFGISNVNNGQNINEGLLSWKESFGARSIVHEYYKIETKNFVELNDVLL